MSSLSPSALGKLAMVTFTIGLFLISTSNFASATTKLLKVTPAESWFGGVQVGQSKSHPATLANTGTASLTISKVVRTDPNFSTNLQLPITLAPGKSAQFTITFAPTAVHHFDGAFVITSNASRPTMYLKVHGGGTKNSTLASNPSSLTFGGIQVGSKQTLSETLTNSGGSSITVSATKVNGGSQFTLTGPGLPLTLTPGHSMTLNVTFTPTSTTTVSGNISVTSNSTALTIPLTGTAGTSGGISVTPGSLSFGNVTVGSSASKTGTLNASGATVVVTGASVTNSEFSLTGLSFPLTIAAGKSVSFTAMFKPQSSGAASANFTFTSANSKATESLSGTGMTASSHSVGLSWDASTSDVEGYNVYRGTTSSGPYAMLNSSPNLDTSYTDDTVTSGSTYFYVTTAVGSDGTESTYSNQVKAVIP